MSKTIERLTLCYVFEGKQVLLGVKKLCLGQGCINGFGGHIKKREPIFRACVRELKEESGLDSLYTELVGIIDFEFQSLPNIRRVFIFRCHEFIGKLIETDEMSPEWFSLEDIPYLEMWPSDEEYMQDIIDGYKVVGRMLYDRPSTKEYKSKIIKSTIRKAKTLWFVLIKDFIQRLFKDEAKEK